MKILLSFFATVLLYTLMYAIMPANKQDTCTVPDIVQQTVWEF